MPFSTITRQLFDLLDNAGVPHRKLLDHPPSRSSDESRKVRKAASGLDTTGAKALVQKLTCRDKTSQVAVFVLPGDARFDVDRARRHLPHVKRTRFLTADEVREATTLEIGAIPPFGPVLLPGVEQLYFDPGLFDCEWIGFNAAAHEHSVVMKPSDLIQVARPDAIFRFAASPAGALCDEIAEGRRYGGL